MENNVIEEVITKYDLYKGQKISFDLFKEIYKDYEEQYSSVEFAELLGIKKRNFLELKNGNIKETIILKNRKLSNEEKYNTLEKIIKKYDLSEKQKITYDEFIKMYENEKTYFTKTEFANLLGIKNKSFLKLRYREK